MAGIYIHIPFCKKRCLYCDFFSSVESERMDEYVKALCREIDLRAHELESSAPVTLYFGGGTPSQLQAHHLDQIFAALVRRFDLSACREITLEANPDDLTQEYLHQLRHFPINRFSIGVQSFKDADLLFLNRRHSAAGAIRAIQRAQDFGWTNMSIDLIYGLPSQRLSAWEENLTQAISLDIPHLSCYHLSYEEGTPLYKLLQADQIKEVEEEVSAQMYEALLAHTAQAGYEAYEISNFAKAGAYALHNKAYWEDVPYLGLGAGAHSFNGSQRRWNCADLTRYITGVSHRGNYYERETLTLTDRYNESIMIHLRTIWGVSLPEIAVKFGSQRLTYLLQQAAPYLKTGKLCKKEDRLWLPEHERFTSDAVIADLLFTDQK